MVSALHYSPAQAPFMPGRYCGLRRRVDAAFVIDDRTLKVDLSPRHGIGDGDIAS